MKYHSVVAGKSILRGDGFDISFSNFLSKPKFLEFLTEKRYSFGKNTEASYRMVNHWVEIGLIDENRKNKTGWRKFSITDLVWQKVILSLRMFGFPNNKILKVKKHLIDIKDNNNKHYPIFEYYIANAIFQKQPVFLLVFEDGFAEIALNDEVDISCQFKTLTESFIKININKILQKTFTNVDFNPISNLKTSLNNEEVELIKSVRDKRFKEIRIKLRDKRITHIDGVEDIDTKNRIIDLKNECDFQDIILKIENGKIVFGERKVKNKFPATE